ncbi:hypothetical protein [Enterococcus sp. BWR-S5]|uniref:hypothetical protein n=1 Tax=Enterococcus sp. BWR-S5 TaxID=2787714 RepID=UPI001920AF8C|nr:hypothetical protein [Enterococcus sp. BWR-S5]MBL1226380.1 hypothetical protein [Enterococcus sp. BWR-S5]
MKFKAAFHYRFRTQLTLIACYLVFFFVLLGILPLIVSHLSTSGFHGNGSTDLVGPAMVFVLLISFNGIQSDFRFFIQNGISRLNFFLVNLLINFLVSMGVSFILVCIQKFISYNFIKNIDYHLNIVDVYARGDFSQSIVLFSLLLFLVSSFALLAAIFNDRFSTRQKVITLAILIALPIMFSIFSQSDTASSIAFSKFFVWALGLQSSLPSISHFSVTLTILTSGIFLIAYPLNKRRIIQQ